MNYCIKIGEYLNLKQDTINELSLVARLHDIGKIAIPSDDTIRIVISNINSRYFYHIVTELFIDIINKISRLANADSNSSHPKCIF